MILENHFAPIAALDLDPIKVKLMHKESGEGWSRSYADAVEFEYRRFLHLMKKYPGEQVAPLFDVDVFWHYHILDTMKYAADCEAVFGYFLHHFPYVGLRGDDDMEVHHRVGERMRELYESTYGDQYVCPRLPRFADGAHDNVDHSIAGARLSFADRPHQVAFSTPAGRAAFSTPATPSAFSTPAVAAATLDAFGRTGGRVPAAVFNAARPTLSRQA